MTAVTVCYYFLVITGENPVGLIGQFALINRYRPNAFEIII